MSELEPSWWQDTRYGDLRGEEKNRQVKRDKLLWEQNQKLETQNQIELEKLQLEKEKIGTDKENAELMAQATIQAEKDRHYNEILLEQEKQLYKMDLEDTRHKHEEEMRCKKLCDELNVNYQELVEFNNKFEYGINSYEDIRKAEKDLEKTKTLLAKYKDKNFVYNYQEEISNNDCDENDIRYFDIDELEDMINEEKEGIEEAKKIKNYDFQIVANVGLIFLIGMGIYNYLILKGTINIFLFSIVGFIIFNFICKKSLNTKINKKIQEHSSKIEKFQKEKNRKINLAKRIQKDNIEDSERKIEELSSIIENSYKQNQKYGKELYNRFLDFRIKNYNEDMENLIRKLNLVNIMVLDRKYESQNKPIDEIKESEGSIKDYTKFIRKVLGENN